MFTSSQQKIGRELANISSENWRRSPIHDSSEADIVEWIPLFQINSRKTLGLSKNGYWVSCYRNSVIVYDFEEPVLPLFPCLEMKYEEFRNTAKEAVLKLGLSEKLVDTFPFSDLIFLALTDVSMYWSELALNWLEYIELDDRIREQLQKVTKDKRGSQKTRQKASKFLKGKIKQKVS